MPDTIAVSLDITPQNEKSHSLMGIYYLAAADAAAPCAIFLHGIPGAEKNHDLAHRLRELGWHVLIVHFSGAWGSGGVYNMLHHPRDAQAAIDYVLSDHAPVKIDPNRIMLLGYSLGSRAALFAGVQDPRAAYIVSVAGFCDFSEVMLADSFYADMPHYLNTSAEVLKQQFLDAGEGEQPLDVIKTIAPRPVLVVHGDQDEIVPYYNGDVLGKSGEHVTFITIPDANHTFTGHRHALIDAIISFVT